MAFALHAHFIDKLKLLANQSFAHRIDINFSQTSAFNSLRNEWATWILF